MEQHHGWPQGSVPLLRPVLCRCWLLTGTEQAPSPPTLALGLERGRSRSGAGGRGRARPAGQGKVDWKRRARHGLSSALPSLAQEPLSGSGAPPALRTRRGFLWAWANLSLPGSRGPAGAPSLRGCRRQARTGVAWRRLLALARRRALPSEALGLCQSGSRCACGGCARASGPRLSGSRRERAHASARAGEAGGRESPPGDGRGEGGGGGGVRGVGS